MKRRLWYSPTLANEYIIWPIPLSVQKACETKFAYCVCTQDSSWMFTLSPEGDTVSCTISGMHGKYARIGLL